MEQTRESKEAIDIPVAKRRYIQDNKFKLKKIFLYIIPFLILCFSLVTLIVRNSLKINSVNLKNPKTNDSSILGHLPYKEIEQEKLVFIEPHIWVHKDMTNSLLRMRQDAKTDGVYLVLLSGYRSIKLQDEIFYSLKSMRNQSASERARVSAPPGYSEHSTGFAIDFGDANYRETDFEVDFENTDAFRWLKNNAAKYHFKMSFNKSNKNVDYEPWHWRYEGSIEALKVFEASNRKMINAKEL